MIVAKKIAFIAVSVLCIFALTATAFASEVSIDDASINCRIKGYWTQYGFSTTWSRGALNGDGEFVVTSTYLFTSDYFTVYPGGTCLAFYNTSTATARAYAFYDSNYTFISGASTNNTSYVSVPDGAVYGRITQNAGTSCLIISSDQVINASNLSYFYGPITSLTASDNTVVVPYQINVYTAFSLDFEFFTSNRVVNNIAFNLLYAYTGGYFSGELQWVSPGSAIELYSFYYDEYGDRVYTRIGGSYDNPSEFRSVVPDGKFAGFRLICPAPNDNPDGNSYSLSTSAKLYFSNLRFDDESISVIFQGEDAMNNLSDLGESLVMPTPNTGDIYNQISVAVQQMQNGDFLSVNWFGPPSGSILMTMLVTTFCFAALGYILFGKKA